MTTDINWQQTVSFSFAFGLFFIGCVVVSILNPVRFRKWFELILSQRNLQVLGGLIILSIGLFTLIIHGISYTKERLNINEYLRIPMVIITTLGFLFVTVGLSCLVSKQSISLFRAMINNRLSGFFWALLGLYLVINSFRGPIYNPFDF